MPAKQKKSGTNLDPDTFFYTIPLEQPRQRLTREILGQHYPVPKGRRAHMGIDAEYKSFKNGLVSVSVKLPNNSENILFLHVGLAELEVACTCGMPDKKLCYHAYMGLHSLTWHHYLDFDRYYWPGFTADEKVRDKFFSTEVTKNWISIKPKTKYGNIFKSTIGFEDGKQPSLVKPAKVTTMPTGGQQAIAYCLTYNVGSHSNLHLPVLMPCLGVTGKHNDEVISFKQFNRRDKPITGVTYNANQQQLNEISIQQFDIAKRHYELTGEGKKQEAAKAKSEMLNLWERAIPLLLNEKYIYRYYIYWLKYLKDKPRKADIQNCSYSLERPVLSFLLKFHQDHFSFVAVVTVNAKPLKFNYKPHLFVFDDNTELCYLMPSVQDDDLLMWVLSDNKRLTVLKEHFKEFQDTFLAKVSSSYPVLFADPKTQKAVPYSFEMISNEIT